MTTPTSRRLSARPRAGVIGLDRITLVFLRHWLLVFNLVFGIYVITPWLAPILMQAGYERAGRAIYTLYSTQCDTPHALKCGGFFGHSCVDAFASPCGVAATGET